ncbi:MAG: hypothetical protein Q4G64_01960 [bacterium]|nr:hypothetical protein [bacterium]
MQTVRELVTLARETLALWWVTLPALGFWLCLGFAGREAGILVSVWFGPNRIGATLAFVAAMVIWVVCLVLMLHSVTRDRQSYIYDDSARRVARVDPAGRQQSRHHVLTHAVVPFLAVWEVWGFAEDHIQRVFDANLIYYGVDAESYSITFAAWQTYLVIAGIAWGLQGLIEMTARGRGGVVLGMVRVFVRGTAILTAFLGLDSLSTSFLSWARGRQVWAWGREVWDSFLGILPDWELWWEQTIPEFVRSLGAGIWQYLVPGLWVAVLLPLVWLALTATVVGWSDLGDVITPDGLSPRLAARARRAREAAAVQRIERASSAGPLGLIRLWLRNQVDDLMPAVQAFGLVIRSGVPFVVAYLLLGAAVQAIGPAVTDLLFSLVGPHDFAETMRYVSLIDLAGDLLMWTLAVALYATAFARAMRVAMKREGVPIGGAPRVTPGAEPR